MKKLAVFKKFVFIFIALYAYFISPFLPYSLAKGVKTSYKQYSIFKYQNNDILCEPYVVNKNDWLYKIFKEKGEISEKDFPYFINLFKKLNPHISNVDAIQPGMQILIPLKKIIKEEYSHNATGIIDIPVVEFSTKAEDIDLKPFVKKHIVQKGDTISTLIDKTFLNKNGLISKQGMKAFLLANPNIKNINIIYEGAEIYLPVPSITSQPWFNAKSPKRRPTKKTERSEEMKRKIQAHELAQLKKYSTLIGGTLLNQGQIHFPGKNSSKMVLDLATSPVIETADGSRILIMTGNNLNAELLEHIQIYWKDLKTQLLSKAIEQIKRRKISRKAEKSSSAEEQKEIVSKLLAHTDYEYIPSVIIAFTIENMNLEAEFGKIFRPYETDLLINFGNVYGSAIKALEKNRYSIFSVNPKTNSLELAKQLFLSLGYTTWNNPSFAYQKKIKKINGLYVSKNNNKLFISIELLNMDIKKYLTEKNIKTVTIKSIHQ